jgi:hypothetical protein
MTVHITAVFVIAGAFGLSSTSAIAVNKPEGLTNLASPVEKAACSGHRRTYNSFAHCMRVNPRGTKYCNKICT